MTTYYTIEKQGIPLDVFAPGDLPKRTKNGVNFKNIITFSRKSFITFSTASEAAEYIEYMKRAIKEETPRWETVHWYTEEYFHNLMNRLTIAAHTKMQ